MCLLFYFWREETLIYPLSPAPLPVPLPPHPSIQSSTFLIILKPSYGFCASFYLFPTFLSFGRVYVGFELVVILLFQPPQYGITGVSIIHALSVSVCVCARAHVCVRAFQSDPRIREGWKVGVREVEGVAMGSVPSASVLRAVGEEDKDSKPLTGRS